MADNYPKCKECGSDVMHYRLRGYRCMRNPEHEGIEWGKDSWRTKESLFQGAKVQPVNTPTSEEALTQAAYSAASQYLIDHPELVTATGSEETIYFTSDTPHNPQELLRAKEEVWCRLQALMAYLEEDDDPSYNNLPLLNGLREAWEAYEEARGE